MLYGYEGKMLPTNRRIPLGALWLSAFRGCRKSVNIKSASGNPLSHIGKPLTRNKAHFVLLFNQMLASGHHREYDART